MTELEQVRELLKTEYRLRVALERIRNIRDPIPFNHPYAVEECIRIAKEALEEK